MSDFLSNLVERSLSTTGDVRPQRVSIFEPPPVNSGAFFRGTETPELPAVEQHHQDPADRLSRLQPLRHTNTTGSSPQSFTTLWETRLTSPKLTELPSASPQTQTRVDLPGKHQSAPPSPGRRATADGTEKDDKPAGPSQLQLPSERTPRHSSEDKPAPHDQTKNPPHELGAKKIIEMIAPERDRHRELIQVHDVRIASQRPTSPRLLAPVQQQKNPSVAQSINVTIGRVEIRAVPPTPQQRAKPKPATVLSLEEYLCQRASGGSR